MPLRRPLLGTMLLPLSHLGRLVLALLVVLLLSSPSLAQSVPTTVLTSGQPVLGSLAANATAYYSFTSSAVPYQQTALLSVAAALGFPSLYVSLSNRQPSAGSFDYFASWQTGGAVSVASQQPPYTLYVAVQASPYSRCNYTLTAEAYDTGTAQSTPIPLYDAQPTSSAIAAGEYRYFAYNVSANASASTATIALTETYGQSWLLLNSPNATQLPTLAQAQYMSASATFPLVALQQPAAGVWTIGVWCNASSAFSIIAAASSQTQPMLLGVSYPGWVAAGQYAYYSLYIDALQLASSSAGYLDLELYSLSGDADLFCSYTPRPTYGTAQWSSLDIGDDRILIPAAQLQPGTLYCSANGFLTSTYAFSASLGSAITLTSGDTVPVESAAGIVQLYSMVFPPSGSLITLSVVADVGTTVLYVDGYGQPAGGARSLLTVPQAAVQLVQLSSATLCGPNYAWTIPGSIPPLCEMVVTVVTSVAATYYITATTTGQLVPLIAGQPMEGAASVNQSAYLSFTIPDNLSNATLLITVTNGAGGLVLQVGTQQQGVINTTWTVAQQLGSSDVVFQLDWNDPRLRYASYVAGTYVVVLSATSEPVTFSAVYAVANASVHSSTIVQLLDGQPQDGVVTLNNYGFYYFTPPAAGWPYSVTVSVAWTSGYGTVRAAATNGSQVGPLSGTLSSAIDAQLIQIDPTTRIVCNPSTNSICGYSISVQAGSGLQQPAQYTITVTTGHWMRTLGLGLGRLPALSGVLSVGDSDYWSASPRVTSGTINAQLMLGLTVLSGSMTLFASNVTREPNATTAQYVSADVSATVVLAIPVGLRAPSSPVWLTVACTSTDGTACQYTLRGQSYDEAADGLNTAYTTLTDVGGSPLSVLLPAGGIVWVLFSLRVYSWLGYLIMQASAPVGVPSLYAACTSQLSAAVQPNETYHTWQAVGAAPLAIELTDLNVTAARCQYLVLGLRASGGQAALVDVSVSAAGVVQQLYSSDTVYGLSTSANPVSYYEYTLWSGQPSTVLAFTLASTSSACSDKQLQMVVSGTEQYPNPADPSTYDMSRTAVTMPNGLTDLTLAIANFSKPASIRAGLYYLAVTSSAVSANVSCQYELNAQVPSQRLLLLNQLVGQTTSSNPGPSYYSFGPVPYNTSTSFALRLYTNIGPLMLYVGVNSAPSPADPSTYMLAASIDSTQATSSGYNPSPILVPASACAVFEQASQPCNIMFTAISSSTPTTSYSLYVQAMSSANATGLAENQLSAAVNLRALSSTYQFSLPASPLSVTVAVNTTSPVAIYCSYQYVTPDATFYDWQPTDAAGRATTYSNNSQLTFTWYAQQLQLNAATPLAAAATSCYCTVQATSFLPYSIVYTTAPLPSTPSHGLSRGALAAAVVVPVVAVLLLAAVLLWMCRGGRCRHVLSKEVRSSEERRSERRSDGSEVRELSMAELSVSRAGDGRLMGRQWHSDSA